MQILAEIGPDAGKAVAILIHFLKQDDVGLRRAAASVLGSIGPAAADAVTLLREFLNTRDGGLHLSAAIALARIAPDTGDSIKTLLDDLRDSDSPTRVEAVMALGQIGSAARDAVPELASHLEEVTILGVEAARALWRIGHNDAPVLEALVRAVREGDNYCRMESLTTLGELGPQARKVLPTLVALYIENSDALYWSRTAVFAAAPGTPLLGRPPALTLLQTGRRRPGAVIQPRLAVVIKRIDSITAGKLGIP
jgi:HEAT repeat protein